MRTVLAFAVGWIAAEYLPRVRVRIIRYTPPSPMSVEEFDTLWDSGLNWGEEFE